MNDKAERANRPAATVGEATGLVPAADLRAVEEALARADADGIEKAGMLADLADILFGDEERALNHGYKGIVERARAVANAAALLPKANVALRAAEAARAEAVREAVKDKGEVMRLRLVIDGKDRSLVAAARERERADDRIRRLWAARRGKGRVVESLTLALDGDQWCVLYGKDLQEGIAGFGPTPDEAILAFAEAVVAASRPEAEDADVALLARVYDYAMHSLNPDSFVALEGALVELAGTRRIPWAPSGAALPGAPARFHAHLDDCAQCREHPFALCPVGKVLLLHAGAEATAEVAGMTNEEAIQEILKGRT